MSYCLNSPAPLLQICDCFHTYAAYIPSRLPQTCRVLVCVAPSHSVLCVLASLCGTISQCCPIVHDGDFPLSLSCYFVSWFIWVPQWGCLSFSSCLCFWGVPISLPFRLQRHYPGTSGSNIFTPLAEKDPRSGGGQEEACSSQSPCS